MENKIILYWEKGERKEKSIYFVQIIIVFIESKGHNKRTGSQADKQHQQ